VNREILEPARNPQSLDWSPTEATRMSSPPGLDLESVSNATKRQALTPGSDPVPLDLAWGRHRPSGQAMQGRVPAPRGLAGAA